MGHPPLDSIHHIATRSSQAPTAINSPALVNARALGAVVFRMLLNLVLVPAKYEATNHLDGDLEEFPLHPRSKSKQN